MPAVVALALLFWGLNIMRTPWSSPGSGGLRVWCLEHHEGRAREPHEICSGALASSERLDGPDAAWQSSGLLRRVVVAGDHAAGLDLRPPELQVLRDVLEVVHRVDEDEVRRAVGNQHGRQVPSLLQHAWCWPELCHALRGCQEGMHGAVPRVCVRPGPGVDGVIAVHFHPTAPELSQDVHGKGALIHPHLDHYLSSSPSLGCHQGSKNESVHIEDAVGLV
mmetsp:Transcript_256/g.446  ORF Transcript_256/g.446 Transcript_256/m.446 type:complete len:221 (+) Transcript_256:103-765(+)